VRHNIRGFTESSLASPKFWEGPNILTLCEQQYFVWVTASHSTKRQNMLELFCGLTFSLPLATGHAHVCRIYRIPTLLLTSCEAFQITSVKTHNNAKKRCDIGAKARDKKH